MSGFDTLQPKAVWEIFREISKVPRDSGDEAAAMKMLARWAGARNLESKQDAVGNLLVSIPATPGHESAEPVVIQGHVDMVCERAAGSSHDFTRDPISIVIDGDWVRAEGTTLGADNGIGVAMGLANAIDRSVVHPPVEVLLTVDEERGLTGAAGIEPGFFRSQRMINLDSEEDDGIFIGCAGGRDTVYTIPIEKRDPPTGFETRQVTIGGLAGGHSGLDINRNRGNAIKILVRALLRAAEGTPIEIASISGGTKRNAIARDATARVAVPKEEIESFEDQVRCSVGAIRREEAGEVDHSLEVTIEPAAESGSFGREPSMRILNLLAAIPHGVVAMSQAIPDLVESSTNLGVVETREAEVRIHCCSRSSVASALGGLVLQHRAIGRVSGATVSQPEGYPGWKPNPESELLKIARRQYVESLGTEPKLKAIHAGLECGLFTEKYPSLDIVSFGPNIVDAHSPRERVEIESVAKIWRLLAAVLQNLADRVTS